MVSDPELPAENAHGRGRRHGTVDRLPATPARFPPVPGMSQPDPLDPALAISRLLGARCPVLQPGHVWLAGAGPGDRGHLTLHALCGLIQADVIVYDALVDAGVLDLAQAGAVREFAGKRGGRPSIHQNDISARLVTLARENKRVLRLKGGDPYVFGRGAEEALVLARNNIPFRIVPGLTAGLAGLAAAGIPATVRGINQAIVLATGHSAEGETDPVAALDWTSPWCSTCRCETCAPSPPVWWAPGWPPTRRRPRSRAPPARSSACSSAPSPPCRTSSTAPRCPPRR